MNWIDWLIDWTLGWTNQWKPYSYFFRLLNYYENKFFTINFLLTLLHTSFHIIFLFASLFTPYWIIPSVLKFQNMILSYWWKFLLLSFFQFLWIFLGFFFFFKVWTELQLFFWTKKLSKEIPRRNLILTGFVSACS